MGWDYTHGATRADVIQAITKDTARDGWTWRTLRSTRVGSVLWAVQEAGRPDGTIDRFIRCSLLQGDRAYGWGKKDMTEESGPADVSCPLSYFDLVPVPAGGEWWRARVRQYHADRKLAASCATVGALVMLPGRTPCGPFEVVSVHPLVGIDTHGTRYKLPRAAVRPLGHVPRFDVAQLSPLERFDYDHREAWIVLAAWGGPRPGVVEGFVGVVARQGGRSFGSGPERSFLIPHAEYAARSGPFLVDVARHAEVPSLSDTATKEAVIA